MSLDQNKKEEEFQQNFAPKIEYFSQPQWQYFWEAKAIVLSQILNYRLNIPRAEERKFHTEYIREMARTFQIQRWAEIASKEELFEMSLTGHLIKSIKHGNGCASLTSLIQITSEFLPYLRKLNGKNFSGDTTRTVKGCLSAMVFKKNGERNGESLWSIDESKVDEFIQQANKKLASFLDKVKKNFPCFEEVRTQGGQRKLKKKKADAQQLKNELVVTYEQNDFRNMINDSNESRQGYADLNESNQDYQIKIESTFQGAEAHSAEGTKPKLDQPLCNWHVQVNDAIQRNLQLIRSRERIEDKFLGILIAFKHLRPKLSKIPECQRLFE